MTNIVTADKKKSFAELAEQDDALLHNSNMLNLVSATKLITAELKHIEEERQRLLLLRDEIATFAGNTDNLQNTSEVSRLFGLVREGGKSYKNTRW
jgi:hypothetical protein